MSVNPSIKNAPHLNKYKLSRRGRKLQIADDQRTLAALPKDVPERTWAEIMQKEENDLMIFDLREELLEESLRIGYDHYMKKQTTAFTSHCVAEAWLRIIDWHFYRHDPGEEPTALPLCYIPRRAESWIPDTLPEPSPKDTWGKENLEIVEGMQEVPFKRWPSSESIDYPVVEDIPKECWFPGKVVLEKPEVVSLDVVVAKEAHPRRKKGSKDRWSGANSDWDYRDSYSYATKSVTEEMNTESEVLQKVTDYSKEEFSKASTSTSKIPGLEGSLHGAGDSLVDVAASKRKRLRRPSNKSGFSKRGSRNMDDMSSWSAVCEISDCRLRAHRLDAEIEVTAEIDSPAEKPKNVDRKKSTIE